MTKFKLTETKISLMGINLTLTGGLAFFFGLVFLGVKYNLPLLIAVGVFCGALLIAWEVFLQDGKDGNKNHE